MKETVRKAFWTKDDETLLLHLISKYSVIKIYAVNGSRSTVVERLELLRPRS